MTNWEFKHSVYTRAKRKTAWDFLTDMSNQLRMEPGIEDIELDGPFANGTNGRTIAKTHTQEWQLSEVIEGQQFTITGQTPEQELSLSFSWEFEDEGAGTRLTQTIKGSAADISAYQEIFHGMEENAPKQMARLVEELDQPDTI
ncbi:SRPBCC family protein [Poritiphilus flavus]|uniref:Polyketide cyclase / dehydrase and lipid transport n=1 Tax=Poritiphilus flavus TaxID=2697053 RepID=A0A6L9EFM8_9FLAO|nr:SRPBCC family protein [Poritiphilus flavus]NAS13308.1 hypothetical protein [Poritiphilus flavus]